MPCKGNKHQHRYLKKSAVPSVFAWTTKAILQEGQVREEQLLARNKKALFEQAHTSAPIYRHEDLNFAEELCTQALDIASEQCIQTLDIASDQCPEAENLEELTPVHNYKSVGTQSSVMLKIFSTDLLLTDNESLMFYTGLEFYSKFQLMLNTVLPMANSLTYRWSQVIGVSIEDEFLILLIKLRRNKPDYEIAKIFNISKTEVSNIIVTWIHFVHKLWSMIDIWPRRDLVHYYMPQIFKD
ncbi:unnamed protein product [Parnassius apollo]|uniref:(apollo) hypothetical protein n=1 Tax=Parnassius apollo TaxID=110799 RepID=A0A8S3Y381_PARAO|nr:unnamed protein product [Parnassius apollo]